MRCTARQAVDCGGKLEQPLYLGVQHIVREGSHAPSMVVDSSVPSGVKLEGAGDQSTIALEKHIPEKSNKINDQAYV